MGIERDLQIHEAQIQSNNDEEVKEKAKELREQATRFLEEAPPHMTTLMIADTRTSGVSEGLQEESERQDDAEHESCLNWMTRWMKDFVKWLFRPISEVLFPSIWWLMQWIWDLCTERW